MTRALYQPLVARYAAQQRIPLSLAEALIRHESGWNPQAVSSAGAIGLGQLMPGTARELGVDPYDPEQNVRGSMQYLRQQMDAFGDWGRALGAYHSGPGNMRAAGDVSRLGPAGRAYVAQLENYATDAPQEGLSMPMLPPQPTPQFQWPAEPAPQQQGMFAQLAGHPLFNMGLGILASNSGHYGAFAPAFGRGAMLGLNQYQQTKFLQQQADDAAAQRRDRQLREAKIRYDLEKEQAMAARVEQFRTKTLPPHLRDAFAIDPEGTLKVYLKGMEGGDEKDPFKRYEAKDGGIFDPVEGKWIQPPTTSAASMWQEGMPVYQHPAYETFAKEYDLAKFQPESVKDAVLAGGDASLLRPKLDFGEVQQGRGQYEKRLAPLREAASAATTINELVSKPGPFGDVATVYSLVKFLDPQSVVREGEVGLMQSAMSLFDQLKTFEAQLKEGGAIGPKLRKDIKATMGRLVRLYSQNASKLRTEIAEQEKAWGVMPGQWTGPELQWPTFNDNDPLGLR